MAEDLVPLILVILILLFVSDSISSGIDEGTFKFLLIQPISRNKIMLSKIIAHSIICIIIVTILFSAAFISSGLIIGVGSSDYPTKYYTGSFQSIFNSNIEYNFNYIDIKTFIIYMIPILSLVIIFIVSTAILISTIVNNSLAAVSISILSYISFFIINNQLRMLSKIAHLIPFTYMNIPMLLNGELMSTYKNTNIVYINGILILLISIVILNSLSLIIFRRKDIL